MLSIAIAIASAAPRNAIGGVPDPAHSTCPTTVSLSASGSTCFDVTVHDALGNPVAGSSVVVNLGGCSITFCPSQAHSGNTVVATTNGSGVAHFCICATVSGACTASITADGTPLCSPSVAAVACDVQVPNTMSYQAVITDNGGGIPADGPHDFVFGIYDDPALSGAHRLWTENQNAVQLTRGGFNVILGAGTPPVPLSLPFDRQYYLGYSVDGGSELLPRVTLTASPYSLIARSVANCAVTAGGIADGQVVKSLNGLRDDVTLAAGSNITITPSGQTLTIAATPSAGGIGGSGTTGYLAKFSAAATLSNSSLYDNGTNVGVGTSSPAAKLDVAGQVKAYSLQTGWGPVLSIPGGPNTRLMTMKWDGSNGDRVELEVPGANPNSALFSFTSTGRLGIGTSVPTAPLHIQGSQAFATLYSNNTANGSVLQLWNSTAGLNYTLGAINFGNGSTTPGQIAYLSDNGFVIRAGGSNRLYVSESGQVGIQRNAITNALEVEGNASKTTAGSWLSNSDARIKTDVNTLANALATLDRVRLVDFRYTDAYRRAHPSVQDRRYANVIAQEFREVFPEDVRGSGERLPNGEEILQVDTYPLTIYSAAAIQELHRMVRAKDAEIASLRHELSAQQESVSRMESRFTALEEALARQGVRGAAADGPTAAQVMHAAK